jgi:hypothetical protein
MSRQEALWMALFLIGFGLLGVERGWKQVCWNVGLGLVSWCLGRSLR